MAPLTDLVPSGDGLPPTPLTLLRVLSGITAQFRSANIPTPRVDAEWLLAHVTGLSRSELHIEREALLSPSQATRLAAFVSKRLKRIPLQQILGEVEFFSLPFRVAPGVLIPRPETEILVETLLSYLVTPRCSNQGDPLRILDVGTGTGVIAVCLADALPRARVFASDLSEAALQLARENADLNEVLNRIHYVRGDLLSPFRPLPFFDTIVSNPPYVPTGVLPQLEPEVREHEPRLALDGGADGLDLYRRIIPEAGSRLKPGGLLLLEVGDDQAGAVEALVSCNNRLLDFGSSVEDLSGTTRILVFHRTVE